MANDTRLDPAGRLGNPQQTMSDHDELPLMQYRWARYKAASNALTTAPPKPMES